MSELRKRVIGRKNGVYMVFVKGVDVDIYGDAFRRGVSKIGWQYDADEVPVQNLIDDHFLKSQVLEDEEAISLATVFEKYCPGVRDDICNRVGEVLASKRKHNSVMEYSIVTLKYAGVRTQALNVLQRNGIHFVKDLFDLDHEAGNGKIVNMVGVSTRSLGVIYEVLSTVMTAKESKNLQNTIHYRTMLHYKAC